MIVTWIILLGLMCKTLRCPVAIENGLISIHYIRIDSKLIVEQDLEIVASSATNGMTQINAIE